MITIETISIVFTGLSVSLAAFYYISTLRNTRRNQELQLETRQAQLIMQLWDTYIEKYRESYWVWLDLEYEDFQDFWNKYGRHKNPDFWFNDTLILGWLENIGVLVKEGLLDIRLIALSFAGLVRQIWEKLEPILPALRVKRAYPRMFSETEHLCKEVLKYMEEHPELKT